MRTTHLPLLITVAALSFACKQTAPTPADSGVDNDQIEPVYPIGEAPPHPLAEELCAAVQTLPAENAAGCCNRGTVSKLVTGECVRMLSAAMAAKAVTLAAADVTSCAAAMKSAHSDCSWVGGPWQAPVPEACKTIIKGTVPAGRSCRSSLECAGDMRCAGVGPTEGGVCAPPSRDGARCGAAVDSLAVYTRQEWIEQAKPECQGRCYRNKCVPAVPIGGECNSNAACGAGAHCAGGKCAAGATIPRGGQCSDGGCELGSYCIDGQCRDLKAAGESCTSAFQCKAGCVSADGAADRTCGMQCGVSLPTPRPGKKQ